MTIIKEQVSKKAAQSKMKRLVGNISYGTIGFANFMCYQKNDFRDADHLKDEGWVIEINSTYHAENTMEKMYKTNGKEW